MIEKKMVHLEGMGGDSYPLNCCEIIFTLPLPLPLKEGSVECKIMWGHPLGCEGCPRDKYLEFFFGEGYPPQRERK
jgi:hypothetical protein